jgi:hypothetical protein
MSAKSDGFLLCQRIFCRIPMIHTTYFNFSISKQASSYGAYWWKKPVRLIAIDFDLK